jgi:signal transduction histidine kinase
MRRRIVSFAAATALLAVVLLAVPLGVLAGRGYLRDERLELQQAAATAAARARGDVTSAATAPRVDGQEIQVSVYDRAGRRVSGPGPAAATALVRAALTGRQASVTGAETIAVTAPVSDGDQVVAALLLSTNLDAVHQRTIRAWLGLAGMCLAAVLLAASGAWLLARRLTRPVDRLTAVAARVGAGDLTARAEHSGVAEVDTLADTINGSVARVEEMIGRERAFSAEVSHQLRTPLSGLRLDLEAAHAALAPEPDVESEPDGESQHQHPRGAVQRSLQAVDRLERTIADVIRLARDLPAGQHTDLSGLLEAASSRWHGPLAAVSRPLRLVTDPQAPDRLRMSTAATTQILDVLLDNACRHGRGAVTVRVRCTDAGSAAGGTVSVEVSDDGPPLALEAWQLFRPRDRASATDDGPAHGIGLPYARRLAEAEGGRLVLAAADPPTFALITSARD